jgi:hypothetical protein
MDLSIGLELGEFDVVDQDVGRALADGLVQLLVAGAKIEMNIDASLDQRIKMMKTGLCRFVLRPVLPEI